MKTTIKIIILGLVVCCLSTTTLTFSQISRADMTGDSQIIIPEGAESQIPGGSNNERFIERREKLAKYNELYGNHPDRLSSSVGTVSDMLNQIGQNDFFQGVAESSSKLVNWSEGFARNYIPTGISKFADIAWLSNAAGRAWEYDFKGAGIEFLNGVSRTSVVSMVGTYVTKKTAIPLCIAGGISGYAYLGTAGAVLGGPLGAGAGIVIGAGAAWLSGQVWDNSVGVGFDALDQRAADWTASALYMGGKDDKDSELPIPSSGHPAISAWVHGDGGTLSNCDGIYKGKIKIPTPEMELLGMSHTYADISITIRNGTLQMDYRSEDSYGFLNQSYSWSMSAKLSGTCQDCQCSGEGMLSGSTTVVSPNYQDLSSGYMTQEIPMTSVPIYVTGTADGKTFDGEYYYTAEGHQHRVKFSIKKQ